MCAKGIFCDLFRQTNLEKKRLCRREKFLRRGSKNGKKGFLTREVKKGEIFLHVVCPEYVNAEKEKGKMAATFHPSKVKERHKGQVLTVSAYH